MSEESTTRGAADLVRHAIATANDRDLDAMVSFYAPDGVWDLSPIGLGVHEGRAAIRRFFEDWFESYGEWAMETETILDLGNGVVYTVNSQRGRLTDSSGAVHLRDGWVWDLVEGVCVQVTVYPDADAARVAGERLAEERG
jgi:ketosteroid isomerase-like protein